MHFLNDVLVSVHLDLVSVGLDRNLGCTLREVLEREGVRGHRVGNKL